jgi:hypothetical protein
VADQDEPQDGHYDSQCVPQDGRYEHCGRPGRAPRPSTNLRTSLGTASTSLRTSGPPGRASGPTASVKCYERCGSRLVLTVLKLVHSARTDRPEARAGRSEARTGWHSARTAVLMTTSTSGLRTAMRCGSRHEHQAGQYLRTSTSLGTARTCASCDSFSTRAWTLLISCQTVSFVQKDTPGPIRCVWLFPDLLFPKLKTRKNTKTKRRPHLATR